ncbi:MAG: glycosyltransferase family 39 protein, partial [Chloroflexi bacterium]|nr:glycosyltransferase family 39 protein [Chloroflexota bacterium]
MKLSGWRYLFLLLFLVALLAPRLTQLNHFVNSDERKWLARSANFYLALTQHDWVNTYQKEHPGVTVTWAGAAGFLWRYPAYASETPGAFLGEDLDLEHFLRAHGQHELELLIAGRVFLILLGATALTLAFFLAQRLLGLTVATVGFLLIAFDPFHIALSRMLHIDGSEANFVCLALIAFLRYLLGGQQWRYLITAGIAAGLAWLTKVPALFLAPFVGLLLLLEFAQTWWQTRQCKGGDLLRVIGRGLAWGAIGCATVVLCWPAMWVDPVGTLSKVFGYALIEANGHGKPIYFDGEVIESFANPGGLLYPLTWLWRTTPVTLFGLLLALIAWIWPRPFQLQPVLRRAMAYLALFAVAFLGFMTLGEKRFDRYLIPIYLPLDLVAAAGWVLALQGVIKWLQSANGRRFLPTTQVKLANVVMGAAASALIGWQGALAWAVAPAYMAYYNPLVGGGPKSPSVMMIGW